MQFYDVIEKRTSVKEYKPTSIDSDKLARIINAAMMSPSWRNNTSYKFVLVDDANIKQSLAASIINDTAEAAVSIKQAPMVTVVVANPAESGVVADREYYLVDSAIAMEHFILAATNEGYGTCWIASFDEDKVRQALSIPHNFRVIAMTPIGEIEKDKDHYPKKDVSNHVFINHWETPYTKSINNNLTH